MKPEKDDSVGSAASGTPRFTHNEKTLLYKLFQANEDVIDIKYRKVSKQKMSVREAWEKIVNSYNTNPNITTKRNYKQIQKFWLNARLRKQYPSKNNLSDTQTINPSMIKQESPGIELKQIKTSLDSPKSQNQTVVKQCNDIEIENNIMEAEESEYEEQEIIIPTRTVTAQTEYVDVNNHQQAFDQMPTQQISVDQISAEKLTLTDLLQFKSSRPSDQDIILQIKEQPHSQKLQLANLQQNVVSASTGTNTASSIAQQETPIHSYYTTTAQNLDFQFDVNYFKTKEAELKIKEEQLQFEKKKIELARAQQELEHMKIIHNLQVEKLKLEIRILQENLKLHK